jgi:hypothetical protein
MTIPWCNDNVKDLDMTMQPQRKGFNKRRQPHDASIAHHCEGKMTRRSYGDDEDSAKTIDNENASAMGGYEPPTRSISELNPHPHDNDGSSPRMRRLNEDGVDNER